jgi:hypothetical protein
VKDTAQFLSGTGAKFCDIWQSPQIFSSLS